MSYSTVIQGRRVVTAVIVALLTVTKPLAADDARVAALEARIAALEAKLAALDAAAPPATAAAVPTATPETPVVAVETLKASLDRHVTATSWSERLALRGDLRLRNERLDQDANDPRQRQRYRLRIGATARTSDTTTVGFSLASGSDDPISRNETLDTAARSKDINIEQAFLSWKPADVAGLEVLAGKYRNPFRTIGDSPLVYDGDLNPEGVHLGYERKLGPVTLVAALDGWWIDERAATEDAFMLGAQLTARMALLGGEATLVGGSYDYTNLRGRTPPFNGIAAGNSVRNGRFVSGYQVREVAAEWKGDVAGLGVTLFGDWVTNAAADDADEGYTYGASVGRGPWRAGAMWKHLEADAVFATFADSDYGLGGTDQEGYALFLNYEPDRVFAFRLSYSRAEHDLRAATQRDADRLMLDISARY